MDRPSILHVGGTLFWTIRTYDPAGVLVDADSTPNVAIRKNGLAVGDSVTVAKRASTTGIYDCSYNPAGELEGDVFSIQESATIASVGYHWAWDFTVVTPVNARLPATLFAGLMRSYMDGSSSGARGDVSQAIALDVSSKAGDWLAAVAELKNGVIVADNGITAASIAAGALTSAKFAAGAITSTVIAANAIGATQIAASALTSAKFAAGAITSTVIAANAIGATQIAAAAITGAKIDTGAITSAKFADDAISFSALSDEAAEKIANSVFGQVEPLFDNLVIDTSTIAADVWSYFVAPTGDAAAAKIAAQASPVSGAEIAEDVATRLAMSAVRELLGEGLLVTDRVVVRGTTWRIAMPFDVPAAWDRIEFTARQSKSHKQSQSAAWILVTNPGALTDGLQVLAGNVAADATDANIVTDDVDSPIVLVQATATQFIAPDAYAWDCKLFVGDEVTQEARGTLYVEADVTRSAD